MIGKKIRLERIIDRNSGRTVIVPMDHGVTVGPIEGLADMRTAVTNMVEGGANAILMHKGIVRAGHRASGRDVGLIIHLSAGTTMSPDPNAKELVCTVEEAVKLGADAVSIHINLGAETDTLMLRQLGMLLVILQCFLPLLALESTLDWLEQTLTLLAKYIALRILLMLLLLFQLRRTRPQFSVVRLFV